MSLEYLNEYLRLYEIFTVEWAGITLFYDVNSDRREGYKTNNIILEAHGS